MRLTTRSRLGRKLLLAAGLPSLVVAFAGVAWLRYETQGVAPALWSWVLGFFLFLAAGTTLAHVLAVRIVVEQPVSNIVAALKRAEGGDFLHRVPVEADDELGELARSFNTTLAAITDLRAGRIDDARSMEFMQRELELTSELQRQHQLLDVANRRLEVRLRELTLLQDLARTLSSTLDVGELTHAVTHLVGRTLGYEAFALFLADGPAGELVATSVFGVDPALEGTRLAPGEGAAGWAAQRRELLLVRDTRGDARRPGQRFMRGEHGSVLAIPMMHQGACLGVLDFFRTRVDAFGEEEVLFLRSVASQAAMAIANARLHERAVALTLADPLTGLHNRRSLFQRLEMELERSERFAHAFSVAVVDVDRFRELNEAHGHLAGDLVLRRVGELLAGAVRKVDTVSRWGGEEFALVLPRADRAAALDVAEKLRGIVRAHAFTGPQPIGRVTISVGLATFPDDARELAQLVDCADAALFAAKKRGRDAAVAFAAGMRENPLRRRDVRVTSAVEPGAP
ncbi:MAG: diguanylate cyclase [Anaeromyxobacteraceae bacterium]